MDPSYCRFWLLSQDVKSTLFWNDSFKGTNSHYKLWRRTPPFSSKNRLPSILKCYLVPPRFNLTIRSVHFSSVQFSSVAQSCLTVCDPMNHTTPGLPVLHQLPEFTQTHIHQVSDAIQPSHPLPSPSPPAPNPSQHQSLFQWVNPSHEVAKVLEFQL